MSDALKSSRAKIRTFAHDLAAERKKREESGDKTKMPKEQVETAPLPVAETPKAAAPKAIKKPAPVKEPLIKVEAKEDKKAKEEKRSKEKEEKRKKKKKRRKKPEPITITEPKQKDMPSMPEAPKGSAPIPSFHELQKIQSGGKRPNIGYDATVITDTKHRRFRLFPEIVASIKKWIKGFEKKKKKAERTYSVPETSHRKGVIQEATTKSGTIFSADSDTLKEHIRRRQLKSKQTEDETEKVQETVEEKPTEVETSQAELTSPEETKEVPDVTQNAAIAFKNISDTKHVDAAPIATPAPEVQTVPEPVASDSVPVSETTDLEPVAPPVSAVEATEPKIDTTSEAAPDALESETDDTDTIAEARWSSPEPVQKAATKNEAPELTPPTKPESNKPQIDSDKKDGFLHQFDTNTITLVLLVMVVGFVAVLLVSRVVIDYLNRPVEPTTVTLAVPSSKESVLSGSQVFELEVNNSNVNRLAAEANEAVKEAPVGLIEIPVVSPIGEEISPSYFLELLRMRTSPPLRQVVTTSRFVTVNRSDPALLLHFTDQETMQGEMLKWEGLLIKDFAQLYTLPEVEVNGFEDTSIDGLEVRSASHEGERVIVYGFIGSNTLLITNSAATFAQIQQLTDTN